MVDPTAPVPLPSCKLGNMKRPSRLDVSEKALGGPSTPVGVNAAVAVGGSGGGGGGEASSSSSASAAKAVAARAISPSGKPALTVSPRGLKLPNAEEVLFTLDPSDLQVMETIGRGACSVVKRAIHKTTGITLALKVFRLFDASRRDMLTEEVKSLYKTDCPAIVRFYGAFFRDGSISVALEYMDGGSLANVMEQVGVVPESVLANCAFQILWGMAYLKHERRIHRDIKPQNILINSRGQVKLTDFGVSKELMSSVAMARTFVGSFRYMAPERLQNSPYTYTSDIWSLGIVLYELATGKNPYLHSQTDEPETVGGESSYIDVVQAVMESASPALPGPPGAFSDSFRAFIGTCLSKEPDKRGSPEMLLLSPWLTSNGAVGLEAAQANVKKWIDSLQAR